MLSLLHGLKISHNVKLVVWEIDGVHEVLVELLGDALDIILRDLTQVAHHVVYVLDRQLVLRLAKRRQEGLKLSLHFCDSILIVGEGFVVAFLDLVPGLGDQFHDLVTVVIYLFVAFLVPV